MDEVDAVKHDQVQMCYFLFYFVVSSLCWCPASHFLSCYLEGRSAARCSVCLCQLFRTFSQLFLRALCVFGTFGFSRSVCLNLTAFLL